MKLKKKKEDKKLKFRTFEVGQHDLACGKMPTVKVGPM